jgi:tetratricopeptide (TPR) repeat protein
MKVPVLMMLAGVAALCAADAPNADATKADPTDFAALIRELSSESYQAREKATKELWEAGTVVLEELREASGSDDPEMATRAAAVLEKIELRITPETPGSILELIRRYRSAPQNQKTNFLNELRRKKAYFQVLKLYSMEDPATKAGLSSVVRGVAISGARQAIATGDPDGALQLLKMSANEPSDLMALACFYRSMGMLGEGIENPPAPENVPSEAWQITLLRAKGEIAAAAKLASEAKQQALLAGLKVLEGDPTLWLQGNGFGDRNMRALDAYTEIALKRWQGVKPKESDFRPLTAQLLMQEDDREQAISSLAALGRLAEVEEALAKDDREIGFQYYLSQERVSKALETIGLDPEKPDYNAWVEERFQKLTGVIGDRDDDFGSSSSQLQVLAGFMEQRGMQKEFDRAFGKPLEDLAKTDEDEFLEFLRPLFQSTLAAPEFAFAHGAAWAADKEQRWSQLFSIAFGEEEQTMAWLDWIRKIEPELGSVKTMKAMMALFGVGSDPDHLRGKWMEKFWKAAEISPDGEKEQHIRRIMALAIAMNDVPNALKARDSLKPEERDSVNWASLSQYLSAAGRWEEAAELLSKARDSVSSSPEFHAILAATYRKAGWEKRAAEEDEWVEKLTLGYAPSCNRIGDHYMYGGDRERAEKWYRRAAFQADIKGGEFIAVLDNHAQTMLEKGEWGIAASCYEALAQVYVSQSLSGGQISDYTKARLSADLAKALAVLPEDRGRAIAMLDEIHGNFATDGVLADDFFPLVRKAGLRKELDRWFGKSWETMSAVLKRFPNSDNTKNTAAWLASRAGMRIKEAEKFLMTAVERNPEQAAYLDTMAELHFAKGDRKGAVEWSDKALLHYPLVDSPYDVMIRKQHERFRNDPLPQ